MPIFNPADNERALNVNGARAMTGVARVSDAAASSLPVQVEQGALAAHMAMRAWGHRLPRTRDGPRTHFLTGSAVARPG
jgi:hypothetical protein